jgi:multisubunit Na+/H+ antiporter MnhE subunit
LKTIIRQIAITTISGLIVGIILTRIFYPDIFARGINNMNWNLLINILVLVLGLIGLYYGLWSSTITIKKLILNNNNKIECQQIINKISLEKTSEILDLQDEINTLEKENSELKARLENT